MFWPDPGSNRLWLYDVLDETGDPLVMLIDVLDEDDLILEGKTWAVEFGLDFGEGKMFSLLCCTDDEFPRWLMLPPPPGLDNEWIVDDFGDDFNG